MADLDDVALQYSYKHDTLFTLTVDGRSQGFERTATPYQQDPNKWLIPGADQNNQGRYMLRINTLDLYLWTKEDALQFLEGAKKTMVGPQLRILDTPPPPPASQDHTSSVVQNLENVAISDPSYAHRQSVSMSTKSRESPAASIATSQTGGQAPPPQEAPQAFAPMAYNPSAPAAPEPIAHREKTPPPPEAEHGTGLAAAAMQDQYHQQYAGPPGQAQGGFIPGPPPQQPYQMGPPPQQYSGQQLQQQPASFPPQNPRPGLIQRKPAATSAPQQAPVGSSPAPQQAPVGSSPTPSQQYAVSPSPNQQVYGQPTPPPPQQPYSGQFGAPPTQQQVQPSQYGQVQPQHQQFGSPLPSTTPQYGSYQQSPPPQQTTPSGYPQATLPPGMTAAGGYSQYQYQGQQPAQPVGGSNAYAVHQQSYQPTEAEALSHSQHNPGTGPSTQTSKLSSHADKLEKGVGRFLKKVEKKMG
jgi:hypothetical protein